MAPALASAISIRFSVFLLIVPRLCRTKGFELDEVADCLGSRVLPMRMRIAIGCHACGGAILAVCLFAAAPVKAEACKHGWPDETCSIVTPGKSETAAAERNTKVRGWAARRHKAARHHRGQGYAGGRRADPQLWYWPF